MKKNLAITEKAHEALEQIQLLEFENLGYKKPLRILASEAILLSYSKRVAGCRCACTEESPGITEQSAG